MESGRAWTEDYYDAMTHYAWAPDELDHLSDPRRADKGRPSPYQTVKRLRRFSVYHLLGFFFSLAPSRFVVELFELYGGVEASGSVAYLGRDFERRLQIDSITQPDFVFENERVFLTIETKINSKSSIEQLQKYAYLHAFMQDRKPRRQHGLLYLTPYKTESLFRERLASIGEARRRAANDLRSCGAAKQTIKTIERSKAPGLLDDAELFRIGHCSFGEFGELVFRYGDAANKQSVEHRLYNGLLEELSKRRLAPNAR